MLSEREVQNALIADLKTQGYTYSGSGLSVDDLNAFFRTQMERLNKAVLPTGFTDSEFVRLLNNVNKNTLELFGMLRHGVELVLDDNRNITVKLFDTHDYTNNHFQVVEELKVPGVRVRRLDVIGLMNGLPIVGSELKKPNGARGVVEAIDDINVYTKEGVYQVGLLKFIQIYVASNGSYTKYFPTLLSATQSKESYGTGYYWTDKENQRINNLVSPNPAESFSRTFLNPVTLCDLLWQNMIQVSDSSDQIIIVRPYQYHAIKAAADIALNTDDNSFLWHSTGSGKTLTAFMLTKKLSENISTGKAVLLLDRNDLADQTARAFTSFGSAEVEVLKGKELLSALKDPTKKNIITTLHSFSNMLDRNLSALQKLSDEPMYFIVDECHRSTFGSMIKTIDKFYSKAQFIGFTGTPRLAENATGNDQLTKDIFGEAAHVYTIKNAIDDKNVLPFELCEADLHQTVKDDQTVKDRTYYTNPARQYKIAQYVSENLWKHTAQKYEQKNNDYVGGYTAMFAADSISSAYSYWKLLTPLLRNQSRRTAVVFSVQNKEYDAENEETARDWFEEILASYDEMYDTNFAGALADTPFEDVRKSHLRDVTKRIRTKEIDLVIVSDMLLTGFDAVTLNTIYLDKNLASHNLLQAMSRTNRLHGLTGKQAGNVIIFEDREMAEDINQSIRLFSTSDNLEGVIRRRDYTELYLELVEQIISMKAHYPTPASVDAIQEVNQLIKLAQLYSAMNGNLLRIQTYDEWETKDWNKLPTTEDEVAAYHSAIVDRRNHFEKDGVEPNEEEWAQLEFEITSITTFTIDIAYINNLLRNGIYAPEKDKQKWFNQVRKAVEQSNDPEVKKAKEAILQVVDSHQDINNEQQLWTKLSDIKHKMLELKYSNYSEVFDIDEPLLRYYVRYYQAHELHDENGINDMMNTKGMKMKDKRNFREHIKNAIKEIAQ
jgi:type I restriction enzyme R subunit